MFRNGPGAGCPRSGRVNARPLAPETEWCSPSPPTDVGYKQLSCFVHSPPTTLAYWFCDHHCDRDFAQPRGLRHRVLRRKRSLLLHLGTYQVRRPLPKLQSPLVYRGESCLMALGDTGCTVHSVTFAEYSRGSWKWIIYGKSAGDRGFILSSGEIACRDCCIETLARMSLNSLLLVRRTHEHHCWRVSGRMAQAVNGCPLWPAEYSRISALLAWDYPVARDTTSLPVT
jgi:hypothetical protein